MSSGLGDDKHKEAISLRQAVDDDDKLDKPDSSGASADGLDRADLVCGWYVEEV